MAEPPEELVENPKKGVEKGPKATKVAIKNRKTLDKVHFRPHNLPFATEGCPSG